MHFHTGTQPPGNATTRPMEQLAADALPVHDYVILCCFGPELVGSRHHSELRAALQRAGYRAQHARHLIRASPVLVRETGHNYRLRCWDE